MTQRPTDLDIRRAVLERWPTRRGRDHDALTAWVLHQVFEASLADCGRALGIPAHTSIIGLLSAVARTPGLAQEANDLGYQLMWGIAGRQAPQFVAALRKGQPRLHHTPRPTRCTA